MRKPNKKANAKLKRKNQNERIKKRNANKKLSKSIRRKMIDGEFVSNDRIPPYTKHIWPNQAQPNPSY